MSSEALERAAHRKLVEGTEVLRTGGGASLSAGECNAILDRLGAAEAALAVARERDQHRTEALRELVEAVTTQRCNGCGAPRKAWGPTCGGMWAGDYTHFYSPEWWAKRARAALVDEPAAASEPDPATLSVTQGGIGDTAGFFLPPAAADEPGETPA